MARAVFYGDYSRFCIREKNGTFYVHDAHCVTDAEIRKGKRSPVVYKCSTLGMAKRFCDHAY